MKPTHGQLWLASAWLLWTPACLGTTDPCAAGYRWDDAKMACMPLDAGARDADAGSPGGVDSEAMDAAVDSARKDGAIGIDASGDEDASDAIVDATFPDASDAEISDASRDADLLDASRDAEAPLECTSDDVARWRGFHLSGRVVEAIGECFSDDPLGCAAGLCPLDDCLRDKAQVTTCQECVTAEVRCVITHCKSACGASDTDDSCRACACANHCVGTFDTCASEALDVCADCNVTPRRSPA